MSGLTPLLGLPLDAQTVALDCESSGLYPDDHARVSVVSAAWRDANGVIVGWAAPFDQGVRDKLPNGQASLFEQDDPNLGEAEWTELLEWASTRERLVFHNALYDVLMLGVGTRHRAGRDLLSRFHWDTMLASRVLDPLESASLDACATRAGLGGKVTKDLKDALKRNPVGLRKRYDLIPWSDMEEYATADAELTLGLYYSQVATLELSDPEGKRAQAQREFDLMGVLLKLERRGLGYDVVRSLEAARILTDRGDALERTLPFVATPKGAKAYFFGTLGLTPDRVTEKRADPCLDEEQVRAWITRGDVPWATEYAALGKIRKAVSMHYVGFADKAGADGRLRCRYRQGIVKTGRMSVERIQLQAIPKRDKNIAGVPGVRELLLPRPGNELWGTDLSQAELRVAAQYAGCQKMLDALLSGADFHGMTAKTVLEADPADDDWSARRDVAKRGNFSPTTVDTLLPTPRGWVRAGDVAVGDVLYSRHGTTRVTQVLPQGVRPTYRVTLTDGRYVDAGAGHHWLTLHTARYAHEIRGMRPDVRASKLQTTEELRTELGGGAQGYVNLPFPDAVPGTDRALPVDPYLLGLWLGDGHRTCPRPEVTLAVDPQDYDHYVAQFGEPRRVNYRSGTAPRRVGSMTWNWAGNGQGCPVGPGVSSDMLRAEWSANVDAYEFASAPQRLALLRGLMDSDGTVDGRRRGGRFDNADPRKTDLVVRLTQSLGGYCRRTDRQPAYPGSQRCYTATVMLPAGMNPFLLPRKADRWRPMSRVVARVASVERLSVDAEQVCYVVDDPDHLYLVGDYVVTHNCIMGVGGLTFQGTLSKLANVHWSLERCEDFVRAWRREYPEFSRIKYKGSKAVERQGFVTLLQGTDYEKKLWFGPRDFPHTAWPVKVQASLAEAMKLWLARCEEAYPGHMVLTVHDAIYTDSPAGEAEEVANGVAAIAAELFTGLFGLPMSADPHREA